jgi:hypothetical protein
MNRSIYSIRRSRRRAAIAKIVFLIAAGFVVFAPKFDIHDAGRTPLVASAIDELKPVMAF